MKNRFHLLATAVVSLLCVSCTETQVSQSGSEKAVNPPIMGWSSWNAFRVDISEDIIKNQADLMVKKGLTQDIIILILMMVSSANEMAMEKCRPTKTVSRME